VTGQVTFHISVRINPSDFHNLSALQAKALMSGIGLMVAATRPIADRQPEGEQP
jgi:hypothetical protein